MPNRWRSVVQRARVQDNLRVVSELIASEVRGVSGGGVTSATSRRFVVRLPLAVGGVCHAQASHGRVYMPGLADIAAAALLTPLLWTLPGAAVAGGAEGSVVRACRPAGPDGPPVPAMG